MAYRPRCGVGAIFAKVQTCGAVSVSPGIGVIGGLGGSGVWTLINTGTTLHGHSVTFTRSNLELQSVAQLPTTSTVTTVRSLLPFETRRMSSRVLLALCAVAGASAAICDGSVSDPALSAMLGSIAGTGTLNGATVSIGDGAIRYPDDSSFFCVYDVVVEFATKNAYVKMGPAGAPLSPSNYECWKMVVDSGNVTLDRYRGATTCKPSGVSGLTAFDSTPISSFGMNSTTSNKVECSSAIDLSAVASSSLGTDSNFNAVDINNRTGTVMYSRPTGWRRVGLSNFECVTSLSPTTDSSYKLTTTSSCLYVKPAYIAGAASVVFEASSTCSYATYALASLALSATEQPVRQIALFVPCATQ